MIRVALFLFGVVGPICVMVWPIIRPHVQAYSEEMAAKRRRERNRHD